MKDKRKKLRQLSAIVGIVALAAMYLTALVCAFIKHPLAEGIMWAAIFCTVVIPVLIYAFCLCVKYFPVGQIGEEDFSSDPQNEPEDN
ncbi:MAG: hypothetical protein IJ468_11930 [Lachnospiraceae bacterium]|nr:hypothetical protein [Lachnospiraceae bacterium]